jgi:glycosyltransferase involved in cell wall biosynthesis
MISKDTKRVLMVATVPSVFREFLIPFAHYFRSQGWLIDAMASGISACSQCLEAFDQVWDVDFSRNPLELQNLFLAPQIIREIIAKNQYHLVHVHTPVASFITRYTLKNLRKQNKTKVIYTAHGFHFYAGGNPARNAVFITLEKLAGAWTDYLVVINHDDAQAAKRFRLVPPERIIYMPGIGVELNYYNRSNVLESDISQVRQELGLTPINSMFLAIAEFTPNKRHRDMVKALARLGKPEIHLAIAGDGPKLLIDETRKLAIELGVQNQVHFLGYRRDIPTLICASVATLLVSEREGLPRSVMESLCLGIPVIGTDIRGIRDLLAGDCGLLVQVGNIEEIATAMKWILDHPQESQVMGSRGREYMSVYDLHNVLKLHTNLYAEALHY